MNKDEKLNSLIRWMKMASKQERHVETIENFAKEHPQIFRQFHTVAGELIKASKDEEGDDYKLAKEKLISLVSSNEEVFKPILHVATKK